MIDMVTLWCAKERGFTYMFLDKHARDQKMLFGVPRWCMEKPRSQLLINWQTKEANIKL